MLLLLLLLTVLLAKELDENFRCCFSQKTNNTLVQQQHLSTHSLSTLMGTWLVTNDVFGAVLARGSTPPGEREVSESDGGESGFAVSRFRKRVEFGSTDY
uniref:Putative secreted peptide n=1 Tax=Anopheles braziliensis TaxID=58242 RepID=A0A2M3ZRS3_9DIPT